MALDNTLNSTLRISLVQYAITEDVHHNLDLIAGAVDALSVDQPDLIILPEVCLTGFGSKVPAFSESDLEIKTFTELAKAAQTQILAGFRMHARKNDYNRALLFDEKGIQLRYDKQVLFSYWNEDKVFKAGKKAATFALNGFAIAPFICYELRFPEIFRRVLGSHLMVVMANWPSERRHHWLTLLRARAIENQCYVVGVNRIGTSKKVVFVGDSIVFDPYGQTILTMDQEEGAATVDLDLKVVTEYRDRFPALKDAQKSCAV